MLLHLHRLFKIICEDGTDRVFQNIGTENSHAGELPKRKKIQHSQDSENVKSRKILNLFILFGISRNCLRRGRGRSLYLLIRRVMKETVVIIEAYNFCQLCIKFYPTFWCQGKLHMQRKLLGIISVDCDLAGQLVIVYLAFVRYLRKSGNAMKQCISCL
jgi:hypothetical protein